MMGRAKPSPPSCIDAYFRFADAHREICVEVHDTYPSCLGGGCASRNCRLPGLGSQGCVPMPAGTDVWICLDYSLGFLKKLNVVQHAPPPPPKKKLHILLVMGPIVSSPGLTAMLAFNRPMMQRNILAIFHGHTRIPGTRGFLFSLEFRVQGGL